MSTRSPLTRTHIIHTAIDLADRDGIDSLSMRRLADQLGVKAMSLYHHVSNKETMLNGIVDEVFSRIMLPDNSMGWQEAMRRRAHSARAVLIVHPWAVGLLDSRQVPGPATLSHHDAVIGCLRQAGFSLELTAHAFSALDSYIYGFVLQEAALPFDSAQELGELAGQIFADMPTNAYPAFTELAMHHVSNPDYAYANEFDFGLELILEGLQQRLNAVT